MSLRLRAMPDELLRFPARAVKVKAAGFRPPKVRPDIPALPYAPQWTIEALDQMLKPLHGKLTATVLVSIHSFILIRNVNRCYSWL